MKIYEASIKYSLVRECRTKAFENAQMIYQYMQDAFGKNPIQESFWIISLNRRNHPIGRTMTSLGGLCGTMVNPPDIFRVAILSNAASIAVAHNHPSGDPRPSQHDIETTKNLQKCGILLNIPLLDHVVCGDPKSDPKGIGYYSFNESGLL